MFVKNKINKFSFPHFPGRDFAVLQSPLKIRQHHQKSSPDHHPYYHPININSRLEKTQPAAVNAITI